MKKKAISAAALVAAAALLLSGCSNVSEDKYSIDSIMKNTEAAIEAEGLLIKNPSDLSEEYLLASKKDVTEKYYNVFPNSIALNGNTYYFTEQTPILAISERLDIVKGTDRSVYHKGDSFIVKVASVEESHNANKFIRKLTWKGFDANSKEINYDETLTLTLNANGAITNLALNTSIPVQEECPYACYSIPKELNFKYGSKKIKDIYPWVVKSTFMGEFNKWGEFLQGIDEISESSPEVQDGFDALVNTLSASVSKAKSDGVTRKSAGEEYAKFSPNDNIDFFGYFFTYETGMAARVFHSVYNEITVDGNKITLKYYGSKDPTFLTPARTAVIETTNGLITKVTKIWSDADNTKTVETYSYGSGK